MNWYLTFIESLNDIEVLTWLFLAALWSVGILFYIALKIKAWRSSRPYYKGVDAQIKEDYRNYLTNRNEDDNDRTN